MTGNIFGKMTRYGVRMKADFFLGLKKQREHNIDG